MPVNVVHNKAQEYAWNKAKEAAANSKGKSVESLSGDDWGLVMHIYQKATKSEHLPDNAKNEMKKSIGQVGKQKVAVKMPKNKKMPSAFDKPSVFFKSENIAPKHPNLIKLAKLIKKND